jgi:hypothetical protein
MSKPNKPEERHKAARQRWLRACVTLGLGSLPLITGCSHTAQNHTGDPLYGEYYPKGPNGQPMPPPSTPTKTSSLGVPPYPASNSGTSTAALAVGLPGSKALAINDTNTTNVPATLTNGNGVAPYVPAGNRPPLVQPIPRDTAATSGPVASATNGFSVPPVAAPTTPPPAQNPANPIITAGSWSAGTQATSGPVAPLGVVTPEVLQSTLAGKGAKNLKQENVPDGVRVSCYAPDGRYLETTARDSTTGLQALLGQIEQ